MTMSEIPKPDGWDELVARGRARQEAAKSLQPEEKTLTEKIAERQRKIDAHIAQIDENIKNTSQPAHDKAAAEELQQRINEIHERVLRGEDI